jgi:hypothetical protein
MTDGILWRLMELVMQWDRNTEIQDKMETTRRSTQRPTQLQRCSSDNSEPTLSMTSVPAGIAAGGGGRVVPSVPRSQVQSPVQSPAVSSPVSSDRLSSQDSPLQTSQGPPTWRPLTSSNNAPRGQSAASRARPCPKRKGAWQPLSASARAVRCLLLHPALRSPQVWESDMVNRPGQARKRPQIPPLFPIPNLPILTTFTTIPIGLHCSPRSSFLDSLSQLNRFILQCRPAFVVVDRLSPPIQSQHPVAYLGPVSLASSSCALPPGSVHCGLDIIMASFYYGSQHHHPSHTGISSSHNHHAGRSRRATRASAAHHHNSKQMRALRLQQKEAEEYAMEKASAYRREFEAARSFDFEDDEIFCPFNLLTDDDVSLHLISSASSSCSSPAQLQSMHSGSDRSSLSSGSPEHSPLQTQAHPSVAFLNFPSLYNTQPTPAQQAPQQPKIHQPLAQRAGKAIPIVDPSTRNVASPPPSVSPARQMVQAPHFVPAGANRRVW